MTAYEIPLLPQPQRLTVQLGGATYKLTVTWNELAAAWSLTIADSNDAPLLAGVPLVTGTDLLGQFAYLGLGGQLVVQTDGDAAAVPTFSNLGRAGHLYWIAP